MKKVILIFTMSGLAYTMPPPYWDSVQKIKLVMEAAGKSWPTPIKGQITGVHHQKDLTYTLITEHCEVTIELAANLSETPVPPGGFDYFVKSMDGVYCK